jgi:hypothetical protein
MSHTEEQVRAAWPEASRTWPGWVWWQLDDSRKCHADLRGCDLKEQAWACDMRKGERGEVHESLWKVLG